MVTDDNRITIILRITVIIIITRTEIFKGIFWDQISFLNVLSYLRKFIIIFDFMDINQTIYWSIYVYQIYYKNKSIRIETDICNGQSGSILKWMNEKLTFLFNEDVLLNWTKIIILYCLSSSTRCTDYKPQ